MPTPGLGGEHSCARDPPKQFHLHISTDYGFLLSLRLGCFSPGEMKPILSCAKQRGASLLTSSKFISQNQLRCSVFVGDTVILYLFFINQSAGLLTASLWGEKAGAASPELDSRCCCARVQRRKISFLLFEQTAVQPEMPFVVYFQLFSLIKSCFICLRHDQSG